MYDIKWIREYPDTFDGGLKRRGLEALSAKLLSLDEKRRAAITKFEQAQARRNAASKEIGEAKKSKDEQRANALMAEVATLKTTLPALDAEQKKLADELDKELAQIPNTAGRRRAGRHRRRRQCRASHVTARSAPMRSSPSSISNWAKRSA